MCRKAHILYELKAFIQCTTPPPQSSSSSLFISILYNKQAKQAKAHLQLTLCNNSSISTKDIKKNLAFSLSLTIYLFKSQCRHYYTCLHAFSCTNSAFHFKGKIYFYPRVSHRVMSAKKSFWFFKLRLIFVCIAICVFMLTDEILFPFQVHVHHDLIKRKGVCVSFYFTECAYYKFSLTHERKMGNVEEKWAIKKMERWDFRDILYWNAFYNSIWCVFIVLAFLSWNYLYLFFSYSITDTNFSLSQSVSQVSEDIGMVL